MQVEKRVAALVEEKIADRPELFLVEVKMLPNNKLIIHVDGDEGISIQDCVAISRHVGFHLEEENAIETAYNLEVSSPGLDRPLFTPAHFAKVVGQKVEDYVNEQVSDMPLQRLPIPMYVVATQLKEGKKVVFNYGNTGQAVRASVSIPSMFIPTKIGADEYVDGGLVSPVPVDVARKLGADIIIAVDILAQPMYTETSNVWGLFNQNINIMQKNLAQIELKNADIVIQPDLREKVHIFDVSGRELTMQAGVDATVAQLGQIQKVFAQKNYKQKLNIQSIQARTH